MRQSIQYVVMFLGAALLILVTGIILLAALNRTVPDVLVTLAVADLTGLTGILVKPGSNDNDAEFANNRRGLPEVGEG